MIYPKIVDDDDGSIIAEMRGRGIRFWEYRNEDERRDRMRAAREFAEGWYQAEKARGPHVHVTSDNGDQCSICGHDLRHEIHLVRNLPAEGVPLGPHDEWLTAGTGA